MTPIKKLIDYLSNNFVGAFPKDSSKKMEEFVEAEKQMIIEAVKFGHSKPLHLSGKRLGVQYYNKLQNEHIKSKAKGKK